MSRQRRKSLAAFWGLCLTLGSVWLVGLVHPSATVTLRGLGFESCILFLVLGALGWREFSVAKKSKWLGVGLWGSVLALPAVVSAGGGVALSAVTLTLIYTLVPVATVLAASQQRIRFGPDDSALQHMLPAITGVGGAALLLPLALPEAVAGRIWFALAVLAAVLTGVALMRLHILLHDIGVRAASSMVCAGWAVVCGGFSWLDSPGAQHQWRETLLSGMLQTLLTAALIVLTVWLLGRWTPAQVSARYLAVPLITLVEGAGLLRPAFTWTLVVGLLMMAASVGLLLREEPADSADAHPDLLSPR